MRIVPKGVNFLSSTLPEILDCWEGDQQWQKNPSPSEIVFRGTPL